MNPQNLLDAAVYDGSRNAIVTLRDRFEDSAEVLELCDWFDRQFDSAAQNRERLDAVEYQIIEHVSSLVDSRQFFNAMLKFLGELKIYYCLTDYRWDLNSDKHHHTSLMLPTDGVDEKETVDRLITLLNRRFPGIKDEWDVFCQNWPKGKPRLEVIARRVLTHNYSERLVSIESNLTHRAD